MNVCTAILLLEFWRFLNKDKLNALLFNMSATGIAPHSAANVNNYQHSTNNVGDFI